MKTRGDRLHKAPVAVIRVPSSAAVELSLPRWAYVPGQIVAVVVVQRQLGEDRHCRPKMKQNAHFHVLGWTCAKTCIIVHDIDRRSSRVAHGR
jgi:hypothetical protein